MEDKAWSRWVMTNLFKTDGVNGWIRFNQSSYAMEQDRQVLFYQDKSNGRWKVGIDREDNYQPNSSNPHFAVPSISFDTDKQAKWVVERATIDNGFEQVFELPIASSLNWCYSQCEGHTGILSQLDEILYMEYEIDPTQLRVSFMQSEGMCYGL